MKFASRMDRTWQHPVPTHKVCASPQTDRQTDIVAATMIYIWQVVSKKCEKCLGNLNKNVEAIKHLQALKLLQAVCASTEVSKATLCAHKECLCQKRSAFYMFRKKSLLLLNRKYRPPKTSRLSHGQLLRKCIALTVYGLKTHKFSLRNILLINSCKGFLWPFLFKGTLRKANLC